MSIKKNNVDASTWIPSTSAYGSSTWISTSLNDVGYGGGGYDGSGSYWAMSMPPQSKKDEISDLRKEIEENKKLILRLEKLLNLAIDNPEKAKEIRKMDPYGEETWND